MKKFLLLLIIATACTAFAFAQSGRRIANRTSAPIQPPANPEPEAPQPKSEPVGALRFLPEKVLQRRIRSLDNNSFRLADFQGKVIVINIWASWCGPCRREVPEYEAVRKDFLGRNVEFIGLTTEDPGGDSEKVDRFVRKTGFAFLLGWADRELAQTLMGGYRAIPQTLVVDTNGNFIDHFIGYSPGQGARLRHTLNNALR
jgi:thiol-disulfide isomerase/thioredoxin